MKSKTAAAFFVMINLLLAVYPVAHTDAGPVRISIERLAVDRALREEADHLQGVFVLLITGHSV